MTTQPEDEWKNDEEFISWMMSEYSFTHADALSATGLDPYAWAAWSAGRAVGEAARIQPRPMSDAPKDGTTVRLFMTGFCTVTPNKKGKPIEEWHPGPPTGWLPLLNEKEHQ